MTEEQIKHMTNRFLSWKLPADFKPDAGIVYTPPHGAWSTPISGTNLFDAKQADAMVRYMTEGLPAQRNPEHVVIAEARAEAERFYAKECTFEKSSFIDGAQFAVDRLMGVKKIERGE